MGSIDIVVPCYRYAHFLRQCVESVLAQVGVDLRVLVIDDASPDNSSQVADELRRADSRVTVVRHPTNRGHIATYNEGIEWASADYMLLLSADDYLLPGALARATNLMDAHPEIGFTFGAAFLVDDQEPPIRPEGGADTPVSKILGGLEFIELSGARNIVPTPTAVVRTSLQKRLGGYRAELPHSGDMEMWLRLAAHASVGVLTAYQAVYRRHAANMSLTYTQDGLLPDLHQRQAALECFFHTAVHALPGSARLRERLILSLARDSLNLASAAFNNGQMTMSGRLADYSLAICPEIRRSLPWIALTCKRLMGPKTWSMLRPLVTTMCRPLQYRSRASTSFHSARSSA